MKNKWENPTLLELGIENTEDNACPLDFEHGGSKPHIHFCTCGKVFESWAEASSHDLEAGIEHTVGTKFLDS